MLLCVCVQEKGYEDTDSCLSQMKDIDRDSHEAGGIHHSCGSRGCTWGEGDIPHLPTSTFETKS